MENFGGPELKKYAGIDMRGRNNLESGNIQEFTGFPEVIKNRFISAMEFTPESIDMIENRVTCKLEDIEAKYGIKFSLVGRDYPLHITLMEGLYTGEQEDQREEIFSELQDKIKLEFQGSEVQFDYVLLDGGNLLLVAKNIPDSVLNARERLSEYYSEAGLKPLGMQNILHSSLARIIKLPDSFDYDAYKKDIIDLRHSVSSDPLEVTISNVIKDQSYRYLTGI